MNYKLKSIKSNEIKDAQHGEMYPKLTYRKKIIECAQENCVLMNNRVLILTIVVS